jgi:Na+/H+-translocating membrane pyrophosphatase
LRRWCWQAFTEDMKFYAFPEVASKVTFSLAIPECGDRAVHRGSMLPYLFGLLTMAVGRCAAAVVADSSLCPFKEIPGIMEGTAAS